MLITCVSIRMVWWFMMVYHWIDINDDTYHGSNGVLLNIGNIHNAHRYQNMYHNDLFVCLFIHHMVSTHFLIKCWWDSLLDFQGLFPLSILCWIEFLSFTSLYLVGHFICILSQKTVSMESSLVDTPIMELLWLTFGYAPLNGCYFLASDGSSSFHAFSKKILIR